jgi:hypothetical protein
MKRYNDLLNHYNVSANRYNDSETVQRVRGYEGASTGVWAASTTGFFQKKKLTGPSQTRTRLPAYTRARVRIVPGGF